MSRQIPPDSYPGSNLSVAWSREILKVEASGHIMTVQDFGRSETSGADGGFEEGDFLEKVRVVLVRRIVERILVCGFGFGFGGLWFRVSGS